MQQLILYIREEDESISRWLTDVPNASACLRPLIRMSPFWLTLEPNLPVRTCTQKTWSSVSRCQSSSQLARNSIDHSFSIQWNWQLADSFKKKKTRSIAICSDRDRVRRDREINWRACTRYLPTHQEVWTCRSRRAPWWRAPRRGARSRWGRRGWGHGRSSRRRRTPTGPPTRGRRPGPAGATTARGDAAAAAVLRRADLQRRLPRRQERRQRERERPLPKGTRRCCARRRSCQRRRRTAAAGPRRRPRGPAAAAGSASTSARWVGAARTPWTRERLARAWPEAIELASEEVGGVLVKLALCEEEWRAMALA